MVSSDFVVLATFATAPSARTVILSIPVADSFCSFVRSFVVNSITCLAVFSSITDSSFPDTLTVSPKSCVS